jgi:molybdopterin converting factor small subunit
MVTQTSEMELSLSKGTRVDHVLEAVQERFPKLPLQKEDLLITVNDQVSTTDHLLKESDKVSLLPHIGGG